MALERQTSYNWLVASDFFLAGMGAGAFLAGFILEQLNLMVPLARAAEVLGPFFVIGGSILLLFHIGSGFKTKIYLLFVKARTSWMSRGTWIISIFIVSAFLYNLNLLEGEKFVGWLPEVFSFLLGGKPLFKWIAVVFAVLTALYPGFLLSRNKSIPFWNTPVLPPLFLFSGLSTGLAFFLVVAPLSPVLKDEPMIMTLRALSWSGVFLIITQLIMIWSYLAMSSNRGTSFSESIQAIKGPLFMVGALILGLLLPLVLLMLGISSGQVVAFGMISGFLLLIGGISLRFSILRAGVYLPRHSL